MTHPDKTAVGALVKRLRAEEARTIRLFDFVVAERDKREFGPDGFTLLNSIKHAISGFDPVLPDAADALTAQAAELANLRATNMELVAQVARLSDERDAAGFDDETADKMLRWLAKMLGVSQYDIADGSEEWDGDVRGTICNILKAGNIYDDEDGRVARLDDLHSTNKAEAERDAAFAAGLEAAAKVVDGYVEKAMQSAGVEVRFYLDEHLLPPVAATIRALKGAAK